MYHVTIFCPSATKLLLTLLKLPLSSKAAKLLERNCEIFLRSHIHSQAQERAWGQQQARLLSCFCCGYYATCSTAACIVSRPCTWCRAAKEWCFDSIVHKDTQLSFSCKRMLHGRYDC